MKAKWELLRSWIEDAKERDIDKETVLSYMSMLDEDDMADEIVLYSATRIDSSEYVEGVYVRGTDNNGNRHMICTIPDGEFIPIDIQTLTLVDVILDRWIHMDSGILPKNSKPVLISTNKIPLSQAGIPREGKANKPKQLVAMAQYYPEKDEWRNCQIGGTFYYRIDPPSAWQNLPEALK